MSGYNVNGFTPIPIAFAIDINLLDEGSGTTIPTDGDFLLVYDSGT